MKIKRTQIFYLFLNKSAINLNDVAWKEFIPAKPKLLFCFLKKQLKSSHSKINKNGPCVSSSNNVVCWFEKYKIENRSCRFIFEPNFNKFRNKDINVCNIPTGLCPRMAWNKLTSISTVQLSGSTFSAILPNILVVQEKLVDSNNIHFGKKSLYPCPESQNKQ